MTKQSPNPRRYSRGDSLDPTQNISIYFVLKVAENELKNTLARLEYLVEQHPEAVVNFAAYDKEESEISLTLEISMGEARDALRGNSLELHAGYFFFWDVEKVLFYANPVLCAPPNGKEKQIVRNMIELPNLSKKIIATVQVI